MLGDVFSLMTASVSSCTLGRALTPRQEHVPGDPWMEMSVMGIARGRPGSSACEILFLGYFNVCQSKGAGLQVIL